MCIVHKEVGLHSKFTTIGSWLQQQHQPQKGLDNLPRIEKPEINLVLQLNIFLRLVISLIC